MLHLQWIFHLPEVRLLLELLINSGMPAIIVVLVMTYGSNRGQARRRRWVNGKRIWVNGFSSDVEFIYDPHDPAGQLRPKDYHMLEREDDARPPTEQTEVRTL